MTFLELAKERYSVRKFSNKPVEQEKIDRLLEAARLAPTACNNQPQRILLIQSSEALAKLKNCTAYHFDAPLAFLVCYDENAVWKRKLDGHTSGDVDASIVTTHLMLAAADLGLGSTWVMHFNPTAIREAYAIPEGIAPVALLPTGYPDEGCVPNPLHEKSLSIKELSFYDHF